MLTASKKTEELAYLGEVSSVPLQQTLRHLQVAFHNFFGKRAKYPRFKSRKKSRKSAELTTSGFRLSKGELTLAKMADPLDIVWSRPDRASRAGSPRPGCGPGLARSRSCTSWSGSLAASTGSSSTVTRSGDGQAERTAPNWPTTISATECFAALPGTVELDHVGAEVVGLHQPGQRAAFTQQHDVPRRDVLP